MDLILHHTVDRARELALFIQLLQAAEVPRLLIAAQGMLNIPRDRTVHIHVCRLLAGECGVLVVMHAAHAHGAAIAHVFVDAMNAEHTLKVAIGYKCRVQHDAAIVELLVLGEQKAKRVCAGEDDLHTAGSEHIREHRRAVDEVLHQRHFVQKHIPAAALLQGAEILVDVCQRVLRSNLDKRRLVQHGIVHFQKDLANHRSLPCSAQAVQDKHLVLLFAEYEIAQLRVALAVFIIFYRLCVFSKRSPAPHHRAVFVRILILLFCNLWELLL